MTDFFIVYPCFQPCAKMRQKRRGKEGTGGIFIVIAIRWERFNGLPVAETVDRRREGTQIKREEGGGAGGQGPLYLPNS